MTLALKHYGVPGMKWGVRKDGGPQGYPGTFSKKGRQASSDPFTNQSETPHFGTELGAVIDVTERKRWTPSFYKDTRMKSLGTKNFGTYGDTTISGVEFVVDGKPKMSPYKAGGKSKASADEDMAKVNPDFRNKAGYQSNCVRCTMAYELRRRGYDVKASAADMGIFPDVYTLAPGAKTYRVLKGSQKAFKSPEKRRASNIQAVKDAMLEYSGKNTRGEFTVGWDVGGGHSMVYEIDTKGEITIRCTQSNNKWSFDDYAKSISGQHTEWGVNGGVTFTRLDNLEFREEIANLIVRKGEKED